MRESSKRHEANPFNGCNPVALYLKEIGGTAKLSSKAEKILARRIRKGDRAAMNVLVQSNLKFVVAVCRNYEGQGLPLADLISEGNLGLMRAAARFDENQDCRFISYAVWWIRQGVMTALAEQSRGVTLSTSTTTAMHKVNTANRRLTQKHARKPTVAELELETGFGADRILACMRLMESSLSMDYPNGDGGAFQDSMADEGESRTDALLERLQTRRALEHLMLGLDRRERQVIASFFGMDDGNGASLRTLADRLGVSKERVRQLKSHALGKLKALFALASKYPVAFSHPAC